MAAEERFGYHWLPLSGYLLSVKTIGNVLLGHASDELRERLLPEIAGGRLVFCQGFSEPEAGSDLAALRTSARREGERFLVSGHKIWTSSAQIADWIYLAVRTDPDASRPHRGVSVLVADMRSPGSRCARSTPSAAASCVRSSSRTSRCPPASSSASCTGAGAC